MKDTSLYQQILGDTTPWSVNEVQLDVNALTIEVRMVLKEGEIWSCPECRRRMHIKDWRTRRWRHLDSCQFHTVLVAKIPVVECPEHGAQTVRVPWADGRSHFTSFFERLAIEVLLSCSMKKAAELLGISWDEADGIKQRAVRRGLAAQSLEGVEYVCVDEKAVGKGHDYVTVVTALRGGKAQVVYVGDGRGAEGLNPFWERLGPEGCARIKAVSMDMGQPYQNSTRLYCPNAEIIFDPFHIMKMFNKAVDQVRRLEAIMGSKQDRELLKKSRQMWLYGEENLPSRYAGRFQELKSSALKTARAWGLKELWRSFKLCATEDEGRVFFQEWYRTAIRSKLEPIKKLAKMLQSHLSSIVTYLKYRFCNAFAEGVNSRIQLLIQKSCGYRNRERLKADILFHFGALNLKPAFRQ